MRLLPLLALALASACHLILPLGGESESQHDFRPIGDGKLGGEGMMGDAGKPKPPGAHQWLRQLGGDYSQSIGKAITTDLQGNVLVAGFFHGRADFGGGMLTSRGGSDIFVVKLDAAGRHRWSQRFGGIANDWGLGVAADADKNVLLTGHFKYTAEFDKDAPLNGGGSEDIFLAKFNQAGKHLWSKEFGGGGNDRGVSVATDALGDVVLVGTLQGSVDLGGGALESGGGTDIFVAKYAGGTGEHLWSKRFGHAANENVGGVATDAQDNVLLVGHFFGNLSLGGAPLQKVGKRDIFVAKYDGGGQHLWSKNFGSPSGATTSARSVATDTQGNVLVAGQYYRDLVVGGDTLKSVGELDIFAIKLDAFGQHLWSKVHGSPGIDYGYGIAADARGDVVLTGSVTGSIDFGGGILKGTQHFDIFVAKFDAAGPHIWSKRFGGDGFEYGDSVATDTDRNVLLSAHFTNSVDFGGHTLTSAGPSDIAILKLAP